MADRISESLALFDRLADQIFSRAELQSRLKSGRKLRVKYVVDATTPGVHIGHAANLWLLRAMQDLGHKAVFIIGDYTARIGDPTAYIDGRRIMLQEDIDRNAEAVLKEAKMVLRFDDPDLIEVRKNSEWLGKMSVQDLMGMLTLLTHARLITRKTFQRRIAERREIHMNEMLFPVLQGYDALAVESDIALTGSDKLFKEKIGKFLQEREGKTQQVIVSVDIAPGIDGKNNPSYGLDNHIALGHSPREKFTRIMKLPDELIGEYLKLYSGFSLKEIADMEKLIKRSPIDAKIKLAENIVGRYHGHEISAWEKEWFENTVAKGAMPDDIPTLPVMTPRIAARELLHLARPDLDEGGFLALIGAGDAELNGKKIDLLDDDLRVTTNDLLKAGKRSWFRIEIVGPNVLETERLIFSAMEIGDIDLFGKFLPEWEIIKYLSPLGVSAKLPAAQQRQVATEVFKRVILQPEPKDEWLWKITQKNNPDEVIGIAHLRRDEALGNENIWLSDEYRNNFFLEEAMSAVSDYAFDALGFNNIIFKDAFAYASAPKEMEVLKRRFMSMDMEQRNKEDPTGTWGFTKEGWQQMQDWWTSQKPQTTRERKKRDKQKPAQEAQNTPKKPAPEPPKPTGGGGTK